MAPLKFWDILSFCASRGGVPNQILLLALKVKIFGPSQHFGLATSRAIHRHLSTTRLLFQIYFSCPEKKKYQVNYPRARLRFLFAFLRSELLITRREAPSLAFLLLLSQSNIGGV